MLRVRNTTTTASLSHNTAKSDTSVVVGGYSRSHHGSGGGDDTSHDVSSSNQSQSSSSKKILEIILTGAIILFLYILFLPDTVDIIDTTGGYYNYYSSSSDSNNNNQNQNKQSLFQRYSETAPHCRPLSTKDEISYTLVTHTSDDNRLWQMKYHCKLWNGPVSLAVYTNRTLEQVQQSLTSDDMNCTVSPKYVTVQILNPPLPTTTVSSTTKTTTTTIDTGGEGGGDGIYPVNELRNLALQGVRTTHIMVVDIDFWVSENLLSMLQSPLLRMIMYNNQNDKLAFVIPAFQVQTGIAFCKPEKENCHDVIVKNMPTNKQELNIALKDRVLIKWKKKEKKRIYDYFATPFLQRVHPTAHNSTNYTAWYGQAPSTILSIPCVNSDMYEPYLALRYCHDMPPFQEIFTGYGQNKVSWMLQLRQAGYTFSQVGGVFVVHFPHEESSSKRIWKQHPSQLEKWWYKPQDYNISKQQLSQNYHRGQMDSYLIQFRNWLEETYDSSEMKTGRCDNWINEDHRLWTTTSV